MFSKVCDPIIDKLPLAHGKLIVLGVRLRWNESLLFVTNSEVRTRPCKSCLTSNQKVPLCTLFEYLITIRFFDLFERFVSDLSFGTVFNLILVLHCLVYIYVSNIICDSYGKWVVLAKFCFYDVLNNNIILRLIIIR